MNFKIFIKSILLLFFSLFISAAPMNAEDAANSLVQISAEKPIDNSYQLNLYFQDKFDGNAFVQKVKNGTFYVFIPDTEAAARNIKIIYKKKVKPSDVKITVNELPYAKEGEQSKCVRLTVETPVNSDIQLTAQTFIPDKKYSLEIGGSFMGIVTIIAVILLAASAGLIFSIYKTMRQFNRGYQSFTSFPSSFNPKRGAEDDKKDVSDLEIGQELPQRRKIRTGQKVSASEFSCFDLQPEANEPRFSKFITDNSRENTLQMPSVEEEKTYRQTFASKPQTVRIEPEAQKITQPVPSSPSPAAENIEEDSFRPELITELKIGSGKGFYLTAAGRGTYALFGYSAENIFFLQKFSSLPSDSELKARFYDRKLGRDIYIVSLGSYQAAVSVSDSEIKELAPV